MKFDELTPEQKYLVIRNYIQGIDDISDVQETMEQNLIYALGEGNLSQQAYPLDLKEIICWWEELDDDGYREDVLHKDATDAPTG